MDLDFKTVAEGDFNDDNDDQDMLNLVLAAEQKEELYCGRYGSGRIGGSAVITIGTAMQKQNQKRNVTAYETDEDTMQSDHGDDDSSKKTTNCNTEYRLWFLAVKQSDRPCTENRSGDLLIQAYASDDTLSRRAYSIGHILFTCTPRQRDEILGQGFFTQEDLAEDRLEIHFFSEQEVLRRMNEQWDAISCNYHSVLGFGATSALRLHKNTLKMREHMKEWVGRVSQGCIESGDAKQQLAFLHVACRVPQNKRPQEADLWRFLTKYFLTSSSKHDPTSYEELGRITTAAIAARNTQESVGRLFLNEVSGPISTLRQSLPCFSLYLYHKTEDMIEQWMKTMSHTVSEAALKGAGFDDTVKMAVIKMGEEVRTELLDSNRLMAPVLEKAHAVYATSEDHMHQKQESSELHGRGGCHQEVNLYPLKLYGNVGTCGFVVQLLGMLSDEHKKEINISRFLLQEATAAGLEEMRNLSHTRRRLKEAEMTCTPIWGYPKEHSDGYAFGRLVPSECYTKNVKNKEKNLDQFMSTVLLQSVGTINEVLQERMHWSTLLIDVDLAEEAGDDMTIVSQIRELIQFASHRCLSGVLDGAIFVYASKQNSQKRQNKVAGFHVHCPLVPGLVMTSRACLHFVEALECLRVKYPDGIGKQISSIFDKSIYPVKEMFSHKMLRCPGQTKKDGSGELELVLGAPGDPGRDPMWQEWYAHGPQFDTVTKERITKGRVVMCIEEVVDLHCEPFFRRYERDVVPAGMALTCKGDTQSVMRALEKQMVFDANMLETLVNSLWQMDGGGKDELTKYMKGHRRVLGNGTLRKFSQNDINAVKHRSSFRLIDGHGLMLTSTGSSEGGYLNFCVRSPHDSSKPVNTRVYLGAKENMISLVLFTLCYKEKCFNGFFPHGTMKMHPNYTFPYVRDKIQWILNLLHNGSVVTLWYKDQENYTVDEQATVACLAAVGIVHKCVDRAVVANAGTLNDVRVGRVHLWSEKREAAVLTFEDGRTGFLHLPTETTYCTLKDEQYGPRTAISLFMADDKIRQLLHEDQWGKLLNTTAISESMK